MTRIVRNPDPSAPGFWSPSDWFDAQMLHLLGATCVMLGGNLRGWHAGVVAGAILAVTFCKEFGLDLGHLGALLRRAWPGAWNWLVAFLNLESDSVWGSGEDWFFYVVGTLGAWLALVDFWAGVGVVVGGALLIFAVDLYRNARWPGPRSPYD